MPGTFSKAGWFFPTCGCTYSIHLQGDLSSKFLPSPKRENIVTFKNVCGDKNEDSGCHVLVCGVVYVRAIANDGQHTHTCDYLWPQNNQSAPKAIPKSSMYQCSWTKLHFLRVSNDNSGETNLGLWVYYEYLWIKLQILNTSNNHKDTKPGQST